MPRLSDLSQWMHPGRGPRGSVAVVSSLLLHSLLLVFLLHARHARLSPVLLPGTRDGSRYLLTYFPGRAQVQTGSAVVRRPLLKTRRADRWLKAPDPAKTLPESQPEAPPSVHPDGTTGNDGIGSGDVSIALLSYFPEPKPDLSQLPHGSHGDVVLDVVIDAEGHIAKLTMARGLGYGVDESVIATVQTWTFHPATRNVQPVPSEQELLFHYEHS